MRIALCFNYDVFAAYALNLLLPTLAQHDCLLFLSKGVGKGKFPPFPEWWFETVGWAEQFFPLFDQQAANNATQQFFSFKKLSAFYGWPVHISQNIHREEEFKLLESFKPDLILSIRFGQILKEPVLSLPSIGIINLHSGILPYYRGVMPTFWSMKNQAQEIGCTIHWIDSSSIDTGPIITQWKTPLAKGRSYLNYLCDLYDNGTTLLSDLLKLLSTQGHLSAIPQDLEYSHYYSVPTTEDYHHFYKLGCSLAKPEELNLLVQKFVTIKEPFSVPRQELEPVEEAC